MVALATLDSVEVCFVKPLSPAVGARGLVAGDQPHRTMGSIWVIPRHGVLAEAHDAAAGKG